MRDWPNDASMCSRWAMWKAGGVISLVRRWHVSIFLYDVVTDGGPGGPAGRIKHWYCSMRRTDCVAASGECYTVEGERRRWLRLWSRGNDNDSSVVVEVE